MSTLIILTIGEMGKEKLEKKKLAVLLNRDQIIAHVLNVGMAILSTSGQTPWLFSSNLDVVLLKKTGKPL